MPPGTVVLCGGESRRMGVSKAWLSFGPERLLQRVVRLVATVARPIIVVAAVGQELPDLPADVVIARDRLVGRGPLQGLAAGFAAMPDPVELIYATATDIPFLEPRWISRLVELIGDSDLVIPKIDGHLHPLAALYRKSAMLPLIDNLLASDCLRTSSLVEAGRALLVDGDDMREADPGFGTLRNLNRREDYERALRDATLSD